MWPCESNHISNNALDGTLKANTQWMLDGEWPGQGRVCVECGIAMEQCICNGLIAELNLGTSPTKSLCTLCGCVVVDGRRTKPQYLSIIIAWIINGALLSTPSTGRVHTGEFNVYFGICNIINPPHFNLYPRIEPFIVDQRWWPVATTGHTNSRLYSGGAVAYRCPVGDVHFSLHYSETWT